MGWRKRGWGIGFSNGFRLSFLCILGFVALQCETVPVTETGAGTQSRAPLDTVERVVREQVSNSRTKRSQDKIELRYLSHDGLDEARKNPLPGSGTYADGKACTTGQDKLSEEEVKKARPGFIKELKDLGLESEAFLYNLKKWKTKWEPYFTTVEDKFKGNCASKTCSFDFSKLSYICGLLPAHNFEDGKSCLDGTTPYTEEEFKTTDLYDKNHIDPKKYKLEKGVVEDANKKAQEWYGKNCKSGKCYYHFFRGNYICTFEPRNVSSQFKPFKLFFAFLTTASILRTFLP